MKYYRGQYLIAVYASIAEGETLLSLCDNVKEFAKYLKTSVSNARVILQNVFTGESEYIIVGHKRRFVEFIDKEEVEDDD